MHFLLLALQGRLASGALGPREVQQVFEEYHRLVEDYRDTFEAPEATHVALRYEDDAPTAAK